MAEAQYREFDEKRTPWVANWCSLDTIIEEAYRRRVELRIDDFTGELRRVAIDGVPIGFAHADTFDFVPWPFLSQPEGERIAELHRRADADPTVAKCYFIGGAEGAIKIGFSVDPIGRLSAIRSHSPIPVSILALASGGEARESVYHLQFAEHRLHGEWFSRAPEILAEIERLQVSA